MHQILNQNKIIDSYKSDELLAAYNVGAAVCDFLPCITLNDPILQTWKNWFTQKKASWLVTSHRNRPFMCTLWKLDERLDTAEIEAERSKAGIRWFADH